MRKPSPVMVNGEPITNYDIEPAQQAELSDDSQTCRSAKT